MAAQFQTKRVRTPIVSHRWVDEGRISNAKPTRFSKATPGRFRPVEKDAQAETHGIGKLTGANEPRKHIAIRLNAKVSSHQRPILKRLERFERLKRLEPVGLIDGLNDLIVWNDWNSLHS